MTASMLLIAYLPGIDDYRQETVLEGYKLGLPPKLELINSSVALDLLSLLHPGLAGKFIADLHCMTLSLCK